jgi:hypothetical protein
MGEGRAMRQGWRRCARCGSGLRDRWQRCADGIEKLHWCARCEGRVGSLLESADFILAAYHQSLRRVEMSLEWTVME